MRDLTIRAGRNPLATTAGGRTGIGRVLLSVGALLVSAGALLIVSPPALAQLTPVTIGADLSQAPNVSFDCTVIPFQFPAPGAAPCSWGQPSLLNSASGGLNAPGTGTIYQVKLRVGASTGPMQLVILRTLVDPATRNAQCCIDEAQSSIFTPVANGITTLNVALPVSVDASELPPSVDHIDHVGLSILEAGVTIPVINETGLPLDSQPDDTYNDNLTLGTSQLAANPAGYQLDMQAVWYPPGLSPGTVTLPAQPVRISATKAAIPLDCQLAPCTGNVAIRNVPTAAAARDRAGAGRAANAITYASGRFKLAGGKNGSVPATLTSAGRKLVAQHKRVKVRVVVTLTNVSPARTLTRTVTVQF